MAPSTYPSRVAWQFRNVTRSYDFWPRLESISIVESNPEDLAVFSAELVDVDASIVMAEEDEVWVKVGGTKAFGGHVNSLTRTGNSEFGPRVYRLSAQDYTLKLDDSVIDHPRARGSESLSDRVAWVLSFLDYGITTGGVDLPSETSERTEYDGMTVREALDQLSDEHRLFYYVDFDKDLHLFRAETVSAPFALDDTAPDYADSFPYREFEYTGDTVELAKRIYVIGEKGRTWVGSGSQERSINDPELVTATQRTRAGDRAIAELGTAQIDGQLLCHEPGLRGGMAFSLTNDLWELEAVTRIATSVEMTAVDPHDEDGEAYLHTQVQFSDRRRARPRKKRGAKPAVGDVEDDASVSLTVYRLRVQRNRTGFSGDPIADEVDYDTGGATAKTVTEVAPTFLRPALHANCGGDGGWTGHNRDEVWVEFDPGDLVGVTAVRFTYTTADPGFVAGKSLEYGVGAGVPTDAHQYEAIGLASVDGGTFSVPAALLTPSTTNYVVIAPAWEAAWFVDACFDAVPDVLGPLESAGEFNSGQVRIDTISAVTSVVSGSGMSPWQSMAGAIDGDNTVYALPDWNGKGIPQVRIGGVSYAYGQDYTVDTDAGTVTLSFAPWPGAALQGRWNT